MRWVRTLFGIVGLLGVLGAAAACTGAAASSAGVWVEVSPASVQPGSQIAVRASCGDNSHPATVTSRVFGTVTVSPVSGVLLTQVQVPASTPTGTFDVKLICPTGSTASTTLTVLKAAAGPVGVQQTLGPQTGGGFLANGPGDSRAPLTWIAAGLTALVAAIVVGSTSQRRSRTAARNPR